MDIKSILTRIVVYTIVIFISLEFVLPFVGGILYFLPYGLSVSLTTAILVSIVDLLLKSMGK